MSIVPCFPKQYCHFGLQLPENLTKREGEVLTAAVAVCDTDYGIIVESVEMRKNYDLKRL